MNPTNWIYLLLTYPIIDYALRKFIPIGIIGSLWDKIVLTVLLLFTFAAYAKGNRSMPGIKHAFLAFLVFGLGLMFMDMTNFDASVEGFRAIFQYMVALLIGFYLIESKEQMQSFLKAFTLVGLFVAFIGVMQVVLGVEVNSSWTGENESMKRRAFSIVTSPNVLGSYMIFTIPIAISLFLQGITKKQKLLWGLTSLIMLVCLIATGSRGAWFALLAVLVIGSIFVNRKVFLSIVAVAIIGGVVLLAVPETTPVIGKVQNRITTLFTEDYWEKSSQSGRVARWTNAYHRMRLEPLFGAGPGHWGGAVASRYFGTIYTDSYMFKTLAETGIIGLTLMVTMMLAIVKYAAQATLRWKNSPYFYTGLGLFCGFLAVFFHNLVENIFEVPFMSTFFWLLGGMVAALATLDFRYANRKIGSRS
ncbi:ligase [Brevibacillus laterosporus]|uniref:Ligase n=1 Tax=Brevibacillus laterosporus TaxID=1465 RepID=A0A502HYA1_BRELA|nr:ligase [Brevibacillus laterosporus]TPG71675.1 ligase [Brevibacillus laterosporus]TPG78188.1 ligase [Brevibacillus laterosporus]